MTDWPSKYMYDHATEKQLTLGDLENLGCVDIGTLVHWRGEVWHVSDVAPLIMKQVKTDE